MIKIYLAGPIEGCTLEEATVWRVAVSDELLDTAKCLDPMEGKRNIVDCGQVITSPNLKPEFIHMAFPDVVFHRDMAMIRACDVVLVNLQYLGNKRSIGTMFEIGAAHAMGKLIVVVDPHGLAMDHPFIHMSSVVFLSMEMAIDFICSLSE